MFEDSTFESMGRIRTRSRGWMIAAFAINGSILLALILIPLIYPEALPRIGLIQLMEAPPPPPQQPKPIIRRVHATEEHSAMPPDLTIAPSRIPRGVPPPAAGPEVSEPIDIASGDGHGVGPAGPDSPFGPSAPRPVVHPTPTGPMRIAGTIEAGLLVYKRVPIYPAIAVAVRKEGTVVLQATISKSGTIENLRVVSGPPMLQQAALDAVQSWRYRPYFLDGQAIEVETTVNVVFTLGR
jgi:periplasmic protein TonB